VACVLATGALGAAAAAPAGAQSGAAQTGSGGNVEMDFGSGFLEPATRGVDAPPYNPEIVNAVRWPAGDDANDFAARVGGENCDGDYPLGFWGEAALAGDNGQLVGADTTGTFDLAGAPSAIGMTDKSAGDCNPSSPDGIPVTTRYQFNDGVRADSVDVTRSLDYGAAVATTAAARRGDVTTYDVSAYVPRLKLDVGCGAGTRETDCTVGYSRVLYPGSDGTLQSASFFSCTDEAVSTECDLPDWAGSWFADYDPYTHLGMIVVRDPASTVQDVGLNLRFDYGNGDYPAANATSMRLRQTDGFTGTVTEKEYMCFFDEAKWSPTVGDPHPSLPPGCGAVPAGGQPSIPVGQSVGTPTGANPGTWTNSPTGFGYTWQRCDAAGANCVPIGDAPAGASTRAATRAAATKQTYTPSAADVGHRLRVSVVASNNAGPSAAALSNLSGVIGATATAQSTVTPSTKAVPKACASRRAFAVHVARRHGRIIKAVVLKNGKRVRTARTHTTRAGVDLRHLPKGTFKVRLTIRRASGKTYHQTRTYHTCVPRRR
jgi:hypothetical protein